MSRFIDEATITVRSGNGGPGCVAFRREKFIPKGGPAGGDGGRGGDVWIRPDHNLATLLDFRYKRVHAATNGLPGEGTNKTGRDGEDIVIRVPEGTIVRDAETNETLVDFSAPEQAEREPFLLLKGGRGGKGNAHFTSSTLQAPKFAQPGEQGSERKIKLELKLLADVGLVGYPNAGKSTMISKISAARPKIADYAFTTLTPNLGVVKVSAAPDAPTFVVADVPGLIEGASLGRGLGTRFLKHLEKTLLLVHLIDGAKILKEYHKECQRLTKAAQQDGVDVSLPELAQYVANAIRTDKEIIDTELYTFDEELSKKDQILAFNKCDLYSESQLKEISQALEAIGYTGNNRFLFVSAAAHINLDHLVEAMAKRLFGQDGLRAPKTTPTLP